MANVQLANNQLVVSGQVNFENAASIYQQGLERLKGIQHWPVHINLSQVEQGTTLLLAIILQWLKKCPDMQSLRLVKVPNQMQGILAASHLEELAS